MFLPLCLFPLGVAGGGAVSGGLLGSQPWRGRGPDRPSGQWGLCMHVGGGAFSMGQQSSPFCHQAPSMTDRLMSKAATMEIPIHGNGDSRRLPEDDGLEQVMGGAGPGGAPGGGKGPL